MQGNLLRIAFLADLRDELVEKIMAAAMRRNHFELTAPGDARICDRVEFARILVQGEFVQQTVAALARLGIRTGTHGVDFYPGTEAQHVTGGCVVFQQTAGKVFCHDIQHPREGFAVLQEQPCLDLIAGGDPGVVTCAALRFPPDQ